MTGSSDPTSVDDQLQQLIRDTSQLITYDEEEFHDAIEPGSTVPLVVEATSKIPPVSALDVNASVSIQVKPLVAPEAHGANATTLTSANAPRKRKIKRSHYPKYSRIPRKIDSKSSTQDLLNQQMSLIEMISGCGDSVSSRYGDLDNFSNLLHSASTSKSTSRSSKNRSFKSEKL